jgi:hypothetical protein
MVRGSIVALLLAAAIAAFLAFRWNRLPAAPAQKNVPTGGQAADMAPAHAVSSPGPSPALAKAYQDLVEVASGRPGDVDHTPYRPRLAEARARALQHYAAVINFDPNAIKAKISWRESWNLLADLPSRRYHYTCPTGD